MTETVYVDDRNLLDKNYVWKPVGKPIQGTETEVMNRVPKGADGLLELGRKTETCLYQRPLPDSPSDDGYDWGWVEPTWLEGGLYDSEPRLTIVGPKKTITTITVQPFKIIGYKIR